MKAILSAAVFLLFVLPAFSQATTVFTEAYAANKLGDEYFARGLYGKAQDSYQEALNLLRQANDSDLEMLRAKAEFGVAQSTIRQDQPDGEKLMLDVIRKYSPDPIANQALLEVANYYFADKQFDKALTYFNRIPSYQLTSDQRSELKFKMGYAYFVKKSFAQAKSQFNQVKNLENEYYYPTNYYYGLCEFYLGNYDSAIQSFRLVEKSKKYKPHIPYYIAQIYMAQGAYQQVINYAEPKVNDNSLQKRAELQQLVGQAYFELGDYEKAVPFLEYYAERSGTLQEEEFYQLGFAQYKTGKYKSAVRNFEQLSGVNSKMGQYGLFYLGDSYLKLKDKTSARNALGKAARMNFDPTLAEDAQFNFAKLSYELGYDRDALSALQEVDSKSKYYLEAQGLISEMLIKSRDYEKAMAAIENIPGRTPQLREAYQKVAYLRGLQLYRETRYDEANQFFVKSNTEPVDPAVKAACIYWQGDIAHRKKKYDESIKLLNQFLTLAKSTRDLPEESSLYTANYTQGYNYLKQANYTSALTFFQESVNAINRNKPYIKSELVKEKILGDATLRAGDCQFKRNKYKEALDLYNTAVKNKYSGFIYALFQKAIIEGLQGNTTQKLLDLEELVQEYPNSEYADDALFATGITYQELGQLNKATTPFRKIVDSYRDKSNLVVPSLLRLGLISFNQGDMKRSLDYYKLVFSNNPEPAEANSALIALEEIYVDNLSDPDGYARFLETVPGYKIDNYGKDSLNFRSAETQYLNGNYERAIQGFTDYITKYPNGRFLLVSYQHRGESYYELKQYNSSLKDFEYVIGRGQSRYYAKALQYAALISYNFSRDFEKSYQYYSKLEQVAPDEKTRFDAQLGAMQSAYRINNTRAVYDLAGKVAQNPNATDAQKGKANFYLGKVAYDAKDYSAALNAFNQVVRLNDEEEAAEARYLIASIHYQQRDLKKAEEACDEAISENSGYPDWVARTMLLLADVYADMGELFDAQAVLEALIDGYEGDPAITNEAKAKLDQYQKQAASGSRLGSKNTDFQFEDDEN